MKGSNTKSNKKEIWIMKELIERMRQGKNSYEFKNRDGFVTTVHGDSYEEAYEKFKEYIGID